MSGGLQVDIRGAERLQERLARLSNPDLDRLLDVIGAEVESQTRRRLSEEKKAPDGSAWEPWSDRYRETRHGGQSLLDAQGHLIDSLTHVVGVLDVEVGSNLVYAAIHQHGGEAVGMPIPARPYLGLSAENETDLAKVLEDWFERQVAS